MLRVGHGNGAYPAAGARTKFDPRALRRSRRRGSNEHGKEQNANEPNCHRCHDCSAAADQNLKAKRAAASIKNRRHFFKVRLISTRPGAEEPFTRQPESSAAFISAKAVS